MADCNNPDAITLRSVFYPVFRKRIVRRHNEVYHRFPDETPALHLSPDLNGVVV